MLELSTASLVPSRIGSPGTSGTTSAGVPAATSSPSPRLVKAAHEFEAQMMKELLAPLNGGSALTGADDGDGADSGYGSGGALGEFATEALGKALSNGGFGGQGFGIATSIERQVSKASHHADSSQVTKASLIDTAMRLHK